MDLKGRKILIADDVRFTRTTLAAMLRQFGAPTIFEADNGETALRLLDGEGAGAECIITDLEMPRLDGLELLRTVRSGRGQFPRDTVTVVLTGHSELDRLGPAMLLDVDAFLAKPTSKAALQRCLEPLLCHGERRVSIADPEVYRAVSISAPSASAAEPLKDVLQEGEEAVPIAALPRDSVLARDLLFGNGRLLLPAHTRLNARMVDRLRELAPLAGLPPQVWIVAGSPN